MWNKGKPTKPGFYFVYHGGISLALVANIGDVLCVMGLGQQKFYKLEDWSTESYWSEIIMPDISKEMIPNVVQ